MAGAGLGQGAEQVAPGGGEVPGLVFGVLRPRPSANTLSTKRESARSICCTCISEVGAQMTRNNVCTCSDAMDPRGAMFSEVNTSDTFFDANAFDGRAPNEIPRCFQCWCKEFYIPSRWWVGRQAHGVTFFHQVFGFSDPIGCECARARTLVAVSCQMGDIRSMFLRCGLTLKRAGSLTCCVSQQANHNRERGSEEKGSPKSKCCWAFCLKRHKKTSYGFRW